MMFMNCLHQFIKHDMRKLQVEIHPVAEMKTSVIYFRTNLSCFYKILFLAISCLHVASSNSEFSRQLLPSFLPESGMSVVEMIIAQGYSPQTYKIKTPDSFVLEIYRIQGFSSNYPVLLLHGITCSAAEFTNNKKDESLAYILARENIDTWLVNFRGNKYSHSSDNFPSYDKGFWDFSFDEMATYDLPTVIDYILNITGFNQLYLVGHSMGATVALAMLSAHPEYNSKVRTVFCLGTTIYMKYARGIIKSVGEDGGIFGLLKALNMNEIFPNNIMWTAVANTLCNGVGGNICELGIHELLGDQPGCLNKTRLPVYLSHFPSGTSVRCAIHFFQIRNTQLFKKYDFGEKENVKRYQQKTPPLYNLKNVTAPVHLYYINGDYLVDERDTKLVASELGNVAGIHKLEQPLCGHMWLVWGKETAQKCYRGIVSIIMDTDLALQSKSTTQ